MMKMIGWYIAASNIIAFLAYGIDKQKARRHQWRIPEATLLGLAAIGGSVGALLGMRVFHHKTKKAKFAIGIPLILAVQVAILFYIVNG